MLVALCKFGFHLDDILHMLIPPLVYLFDATKHPIHVSLAAMETVIQLAQYFNLTEFASRIILGLVIICFSIIIKLLCFKSQMY